MAAWENPKHKPLIKEIGRIVQAVQALQAKAENKKGKSKTDSWLTIDTFWIMEMRIKEVKDDSAFSKSRNPNNRPAKSENARIGMQPLRKRDERVENCLIIK